MIDANKVYLKVKLSSLAQEARIIRKLERSINRRANATRKKFQSATDLTSETSVKFQKNWQSQAATVVSLNEHRKGKVSLEARATNIALGFLNNRAYEEIENRTYRTSVYKQWHWVVNANHCHGKPYGETMLWDRVASIAWKYASYKVKKAIFDSYFKENPNCNWKKDTDIGLTSDHFKVVLHWWRSKHPLWLKK